MHVSSCLVFSLSTRQLLLCCPPGEICLGLISYLYAHTDYGYEAKSKQSRFNGEHQHPGADGPRPLPTCYPRSSCPDQRGCSQAPMMPKCRSKPGIHPRCRFCRFTYLGKQFLPTVHLSRCAVNNGSITPHLPVYRWSRLVFIEAAVTLLRKTTPFCRMALA